MPIGVCVSRSRLCRAYLHHDIDGHWRAQWNTEVKRLDAKRGVAMNGGFERDIHSRTVKSLGFKSIAFAVYICTYLACIYTFLC